MMKTIKVQPITMLLAAGIVISGCDGLGKMVKNANQVKYEVTPNPLELHGDSVAVNINVKYPAKFFAKKAAVEATPVLKGSGDEKAFKSVKFKGEKSTAEGTVIAYANGGSYAYSDKIAYSPDLKVSDLKIKAVASVKSKSKEFAEVKVGEGVITTPLLVANDDKPSLGADKFTKTVPRNYSADIHFLIQSAEVRGSELSQSDIKGLKEYFKTGKEKGYIYNGVSIHAYASPDGEEALNTGLSENRAKNAARVIADQFKAAKIEAVKNADFIKTANTPEDWEGFKSLMQQSDIKDKDLIIRVLEMYSDPVQREKEIKNLAATYKEVADKILPQLRRAMITINAEEPSRTDEQISALVVSSPDSLSIEEILYAATLTTDLDKKLSIYRSAQRVYPQDWRGFNNAGYVLILQNKLSEAKAELDKANSISANNPIVLNNMGVVAHLQGDRKKAEEYFTNSSDANAKYNLGIIQIQKGNYTAAVSSLNAEKSYNLALAQLLNGNADAALSTLEASKDKDSARGYYLKAIIGARKGDVNLMINNLKNCVAKDASYKAKAKEDMEFAKYKSNAEFAGVIN
ncbi:MAG: tetratricopeptide repeat protein [Bacteroidia bacterium]